MNGYIYLIHAIGTSNYKIGKTSQNPQKRLADLQTGNHCKLRLLEQIEVDNMDMAESQMHAEYKRNRFEGEWFAFDDIAPVIAHFKTGVPPENQRKPSPNDDIVMAIEDLSSRVDTLQQTVADALGRIADALEGIELSQRAKQPRGKTILIAHDGRELDKTELWRYVSELEWKSEACLVHWNVDNVSDDDFQELI